MAPGLFTYDITTLQPVITWHCSLTVRPVVEGIAPKREYEHPKEGNNEHHNRQEETRHKPVTGSLTTHKCVRHNGTLSSWTRTTIHKPYCHQHLQRSHQSRFVTSTLRLVFFFNGISLMPRHKSTGKPLPGHEKLKHTQKVHRMNTAAVDHLHRREKKKI